MVVELKNEMKIRGTLHSVDQFLNIKLENITVLDEEKYPHMVGDIFLEGRCEGLIQICCVWFVAFDDTVMCSLVP